VRDQVLHPYKTTGRIMVLYILTFTFLDSRQEHKRILNWERTEQKAGSVRRSIHKMYRVEQKPRISLSSDGGIKTLWNLLTKLLHGKTTITG
jgi:hypothetical protein